MKNLILLLCFLSCLLALYDPLVNEEFIDNFNSRVNVYHHKSIKMSRGGHMINVDPENPDPFFRYKMPEIEIKNEGKGNGMKTIIVNLDDISKAIYRSPEMILKYMGYKLGAAVKEDKTGQFVIQGKRDQIELQEIMNEFIVNYVLCPKCRNPETSFEYKEKKEKFYQYCGACGHNGHLSRKTNGFDQMSKSLMKEHMKKNESPKSEKKKLHKLESQKSHNSRVSLPSVSSLDTDFQVEAQASTSN